MNKSLLLTSIAFYLIFLGSSSSSSAQTMIMGRVTDADSKEALLGVNVTIKDKMVGTITENNGQFILSTKVTPPFTLLFSCVGYASIEKEITAEASDIDIELKEQSIFGEEVVISASRVEENILTSPVTIEKLSLIDIQQGSGANFFDDLYKLKGVDMNVSSLTFRYPNTRGFSGESNYRLNQLVDGVENISPGLSFAAGNMFGISQLDVESVELLVGASSALYGPGGMNGTLLMTSKNPFDYQGLSATVQTGIMHMNADYQDSPSPMYDVNLRYAKSFNNRVAFKIVGSYLTAQDWNASDFRDRGNREAPPFDPNNPDDRTPGYDGINVYGDDIIVPVNMNDKSLPPEERIAYQIADGIAQSQGIEPGTPEYLATQSLVFSKLPDQVISRTGWLERDLVDYNTTNLRLSGALHYRINENIEAIAQANVSNGTAVYTAQNRFSVLNFNIGMGKLELKSNNWYVRTWGVMENSGDSYDAAGSALQLQEAWKPSEQWYEEYFATFTQSVLLGTPEDEAHKFSRLIADNRTPEGTVFNPNKAALPLPGTDDFNTLWDPMISTPISEGGGKVIDKSKVWQVEGLYNFSQQIKLVELMVGANYRLHWVNSQGTVFFDKPGQPIQVYQIGAFAQMAKSFFNNRFKITASARYDKHQKFDGEFTPRFSMTWAMDPNKEHNIRASYQTAFRFPSISDQWTELDVGVFNVLGGLPEVHNAYGFNSSPVYPLSGPNPITDEPVTDNGPFVIPIFGPEKVTAMELGYKGLALQKMLFIDAYVYHNRYDGFLTQQLLAQYPNTPEEKRYNTTISTDDNISSWGWAVGLDFRLPKGFYTGGNIAYNTLESGVQEVGRQNRYNTPDYRYNLNFGNRDVFKNVGFNLNYRWQDEFLWESPFGVGLIPAFSTLDASISYKISNLKSIVKIGGSNITNQYYTTSFGNPQIGGLYYISWHFDQFMN